MRSCLLVCGATLIVSCSGGKTGTPASPDTPRPAAPQSAATKCTRYASPTGSDSRGRGTIGRPFASVTRLDRSLRPGETGCLRAGTYGSIHTRFQLHKSGTPSRRITITSYPGETAKIVGWIEMEGSYRTLSHLQIDGSNTFDRSSQPGTSCPHPVSQGLVIAGHDDIFEHNEYYQSIPSLRSNGLGVGWWGNADNTTIRYNRIHDVGQCRAFDHLIYVASGTNVQIYNNWMWNDRHGWGVQIYPRAHDAHVHNNVIDHAGSGFTVAGKPSVADNVIEYNVVINSTGLVDAGVPKGVGISDSWESRPGTGNVFRFNDVFNNPGGIAKVEAVVLHGNTSAAPVFVNARRHDYRVVRIGPRNVPKIQTALR